MAGRGPAPKTERRNKADTPIRGEWTAEAGSGWQHGSIPTPPARLTVASRQTWDTWMTAWFAAHWGPEDLPLLRQLIRLYDRIERGEGNTGDRAEFRQMADSFGITKKGQQDRRWAQPKNDAPSVTASTADRYAHLKVV